MRVRKVALMRRSITLLAVLGVLLVPMTIVFANQVPAFDFATPVFGLATAPDGSLLVADAGAGVVELRKGEGNLIAELPFVADIAPIGRGDMFAVTGLDPFGAGETAQKLFRVSHGSIREIADLYAFEEEFNPDNAQIVINLHDLR